jgi:restriction system protein
MARQSFLAEIQRQVRASQREAERNQKAAARDHQAAIRKAERARKAEERAAAQAERATEAERKRLERDAKAAHVAAKKAEVEELNAALADLYDEIDGLLAATLDVDDYVDLNELRRTVKHPPFDRTDLESAIPTPPEMPDPAEPAYEAPEPPAGLFGKKKKQAAAEAEAKAAHAEALAAWQEEVDALPARREEDANEHARAESERIASLENERTRYDEECAARNAEVAEHNAAIDTLVTNLGYGAVDAIEEYVSIVLSNSVYPERFDISSTFEFDPTTAELRLRTLIPGPDSMPSIKMYKYTMKTDEITTTALSQKASRDRYLTAVQQVALRSLHEVFEADRRGLINTISLELGTETIDPATGNQAYIPFVAVAADRETFMSFDLSAVMPAATLDHLGAAVSKNPFGLVPANTTGIRST